MSQTLSAGRIVHYTLTATDADHINHWRATGECGLIGNVARANDVYPAMVIRAFTEDRANLQVFLDGNDTLWRTSVPWALSSSPGNWSWPPRVGAS